MPAPRPLREGLSDQRGAASEEAENLHQEEHAEPHVQRGARVRRGPGERGERGAQHRGGRLRLVRGVARAGGGGQGVGPGPPPPSPAAHRRSHPQHRAQRGDRRVPRGPGRRRPPRPRALGGDAGQSPQARGALASAGGGERGGHPVPLALHSRAHAVIHAERPSLWAAESDRLGWNPGSTNLSCVTKSTLLNLSVSQFILLGDGVVNSI